ncbi:hypothetical protein L1785_14560 [Antribacter sp. KLBMP9083]|uniref:Uncharacterized protein n=1 Tax=Antribacter soli TaxID=2910976 RepID=A0AA41QHI3_9MICO|nr:hypothetical protein [Antribacter soli]MCF4122199.1 hypothetical protein [Antribacter soli]
MSITPYVWLLIPLGALLAIILGGVLITRQQKKIGTRASALAGRPTVNGFQQAAGESREDFVRRHQNRSGVVANGATLVDLYDRVRRLEERITAVESDQDRQGDGSA